MTQLAVVAYPTLGDDDRRWIEGVRARYDPMASRIAAHFTLVFPTDAAQAPVVAQVRNALQSCESIPVVLRRAAVLPDALGSGTLVVLLAEQGHRELVAMHDALYDGVLAAYRRRDIPYVPHVTVGAHPQRGECERIADQLGDERRIVRARIDSVDVIEVGADMVRTVAEIPLACPAGKPAA